MSTPKKRLAGKRLSEFGEEIDLASDSDNYFQAQETSKELKKGNPYLTAQQPSQKPVTAQGSAPARSRSASLNPYLSVEQKNPVNISGDNNQIDNSINQNTYDMSDNRRYYGGSSRTFNYQGGNGLDSLYDSPVSMASMGGFYDVDDSPAAAASFLDRYIGMNLQNQNDTRANYDSFKNTDYSKSTASGFDYGKAYSDIQKTIDKAYARGDARIDKMFGDKNALIGINPDASPDLDMGAEEGIDVAEPEEKEEN